MPNTIKGAKDEAPSWSYDNNGNMTGKTDSTGTTTYAWDYENRLTQGRPCSTFAADAWHAGTGETLNTQWGPISNPSTLTNSIISANGGQANLTVQQQPNGSSSWSRTYGSNSSSSSSSSGSSLNSSGSSLQ